AVAGDELDVPLEHRVIQRLAETPPNEVRAERLEDILEGPGTRPFAHRIAHVHAAGEYVCHDDVVCVGPVIHQVDDDVALGDLLQRDVVVNLMNNRSNADYVVVAY